MTWWNIIKAHPRLVQLLGDEDEKIVQLANEAEVVELFNASNPKVGPYETRAAKGLENDYPIDTFFGVVKRVEGEPRLVAVGGYAKRKGKNGKTFAYVGGLRSALTGYGKMIRDHYVGQLQGIPKIAGFTKKGAERFDSGNRPETHEVIPDEVLDYFRNATRYHAWDIKKTTDWMVWI